MGKSRAKLTEGPIFKSFWFFAVPILPGTVVTRLYNMVDSMIAANSVAVSYYGGGWKRVILKEAKKDS